MDLKQLTRKMKTESTKLKKQLEAAPAKVKKGLDAQAKKLEGESTKLRRQLETAPAKLKKQVTVEAKKLEAARARLAKQLDPTKLMKQLEELPAKAVDAVGIVRTSQLKAVKAELGKLSKRIDALSGASSRQDAA